MGWDGMDGSLGLVEYRAPYGANNQQQKQEIQPKNSNRKYRIPNIKKYLTANTGNPTQTWQS